MSSSDSDCESDSDNLLMQMLQEEEEKRKRKKKLLTVLLLASVPIALDDCDNPFFHERLNWTEHVAELNKEGPNEFFLMYRNALHFIHETLFSN